MRMNWGGGVTPSPDASHATPAGPSAVTGRPEEAAYLYWYLRAGWCSQLGGDNISVLSDCISLPADNNH